MEGFRWSLGTLVAGVTAFMAISGWAPRMESDRYEAPALSPAAHAQITAYVKPMRAYAHAFKGAVPPTDQEVNEVARLWVKEFVDGNLAQVGTLMVDDSCRDGVKSQILDARDTLAHTMRLQGDRMAQRKDFNGAARCYSTALWLLEVMKYSELPSMVSSFGYQNQVLKQACQLPLDSQKLIQWSRPANVPSEIRRLARVAVVLDDGMGRGGRVIESKFVTQGLAHMSQLSLDPTSIHNCVRAVSNSATFPARPGLHIRLAVQRWYEQEYLIRALTSGDNSGLACFVAISARSAS